MTFNETLEKHFSAIKNRDVDQYRQLVKNDENVTMIFPSGSVITGFQAVIDFHIEWFADKDWTMEHELVNICESGELSYALYKTRYMEKDSPDTLNCYLYLLFQLVDGKWQLIYDQNTIIKG